MADLIIYGGPGCRQCQATLRSVKALGLSHDYIDVSVDIAAAADLIRRDLRHLPVVVAGSEVWEGFRPDLLEQIARKKP